MTRVTTRKLLVDDANDYQISYCAVFSLLDPITFSAVIASTDSDVIYRVSFTHCCPVIRAARPISSLSILQKKSCDANDAAAPNTHSYPNVTIANFSKIFLRTADCDIFGN